MAIDRFSARVNEVRPAARRDAPDAAFSLRPRLLALRETLIAAVRQRHLRNRQNPAPLFYFDKDRQAEFLDSPYAKRSPAPNHSPLFEKMTSTIREIWPTLVADADVRHAARALDGLHSSATALASDLPSAKDLADLLHAIDDEVLCVIEPATRAGFTLEVRGVAQVDQLHDLLGSVQPRLHQPDALTPTRPQHQFFMQSGLQADGTLPAGPLGAVHWLFNDQPATAIPRIAGERVVLLGDPLPTATRAAQVRFPDLMTEVRVLRSFTAGEVEERLSTWYGEPISTKVAPLAIRQAA